MAGEMNATAAAAAAEPVRRAYVTFLPGADDGERLGTVVRLAEEMRRVGAAYPLVVAVLRDVPEEQRRILASLGCVVRKFVDYEGMANLNAGIHVRENIEELFDLEEGHFYTAKLGGPPPARYFEAGNMFVHEPSAATAKALLDALRVTPPESFPEQQDYFLNMFFRDQYKAILLDHNNLVVDLDHAGTY